MYKKLSKHFPCTYQWLRPLRLGKLSLEGSTYLHLKLRFLWLFIAWYYGQISADIKMKHYNTWANKTGSNFMIFI